MAARDVLQSALDLLRPRARRSAVAVERAHLELRPMASTELVVFERSLGEALSGLSGVRWHALNAPQRRVVVGYTPGSCTLADLTAAVERAERDAAIDRTPFAEAVADHPADREPGQQLILEVGADLIGAAVGTALSLSWVPSSLLAARGAALAGVVRSTPRLRQGLDRQLGVARTDLVLGLVSPALNALAQRPGAALVDAVHRGALLREAHARRQAWLRREPELAGTRERAAGPVDAIAARPVPLPDGPIEEYVDRAWIVSLGGFLVSFVTTRSFQRAVAALFGGVPRPARLGREVFSAEIGRVLSEHGVLVLDPEALRRLDRIDCVLLEGKLAARERAEVGRVHAEGREVAEIRAVASRLLDADRLLEARSVDGWWLGPPARLAAGLSDGLAAAAAALAREGALVLGVAHAGDVVGLVEVVLPARTGIDELVASAQQAGLRVVLATSDARALARLGADDGLGEGENVVMAVRRLQREGRGVMFVGTGPSPGLAAADLGVGLLRPGAPTPWGAHLLAGDDLSEVRGLIAAAALARHVSKQSVNVALTAASLGAVVSAGGVVSMGTTRVLRVVNLATLVSMLNGLRASTSLARRGLPAPRDRTPWHALDAQGVIRRLGTDTQKGLALAEVVQRTPAPRHQRTAIAELTEAVGDELFNPLAPLLAAGAGLSAVVGSAADAAMLGGVVVLNAAVGGVQRFRTERALRQLERSVERRAMVRRGGVLREVGADELVPGDLVVLGPGDVVPADCRLVQAESLEIDSSTLTGESLPVHKGVAASLEDAVADRSSMLYEGTAVVAGAATAVVVAIGDAMESRRGARAQRDRLPTGVEQRLRQLIGYTGPVAIGAAAAVVGAGLLRGRPLEDLIGSGVSLAVASLPEGLPLLATAAQLSAAERLSQRGALVRNPRALEALGRVDVVCVDKTGTVTQGRLEVCLISDGVEERVVEGLMGPLLRVVAAAQRASGVPMSGLRLDATDVAIGRCAERLSLGADYACEGWRRLSELAFESGRAYHATLGRTRVGARLCVKGAPEALLPHCREWRRGTQTVPLTDADRERVAATVNALAARGLRVLAVAEQDLPSAEPAAAEHLDGLTLLGLVALSDPVRPAAAAALDRLRRAGVRTVMITGDHPSTARAIAAELGMRGGEAVLTGAELGRLTDDELDAHMGSVTVLARVAPAQKVRIVRALQRTGRVVAMVGDGANDAPAIRLANVGIAIGDHTAAARAAADVVLTDERIETIADAVAEGRAVWAAVRDAVSILIGGNFGEIGFTVLAGLLDGRPPLHPRQLLLVNLLTDVAPAMAIALRPPTRAQLDTLASEGPDASLGPLLTRDIAGRAAVTAMGAGGAWVVGRLTGSAERARTIGLVALVGTQLGQTMASGGLTTPVVLTSLGSAAILGLIVQTPGLSGLFGCRPLGPLGWATALGASAAATGAAVYAPRLAEQAYRQLVGRPIVPEGTPEALVPAKG